MYGIGKNTEKVWEWEASIGDTQELAEDCSPICAEHIRTEDCLGFVRNGQWFLR